jgi:hypothetical protein
MRYVVHDVCNVHSFEVESNVRYLFLKICLICIEEVLKSHSCLSHWPSSFTFLLVFPDFILKTNEQVDTFLFCCNYSKNLYWFANVVFFKLLFLNQYICSSSFCNLQDRRQYIKILLR